MKDRSKVFPIGYSFRLKGRLIIPAGLGLLLISWLVMHAHAPAFAASGKAGKTDPVLGPVPQKTSEVYVPDPQDITAATFAENLEIPWELVFLPDGRALVTERPGRIRIISRGKLLDEPYATVHTEATGEGGLMGLALHPDYPRSPYLYVMYTYRDGGNLFNKVERFRDTGGTAVPEKVIIEKIPGARVHNGGRIAFGPDKMLYVCTGDARQPETAQDLGSLGGKILRLTPEGAFPEDNPFEKSPVYAYGLRNPQGLAWEPHTRTLFCSDHGPSGEFGLRGNDSIKIIQKGGNYGWPLIIGEVQNKAYIDPVILWREATPPAGMTFFQGSLYVATLRSEALVRIGMKTAGNGYETTSIERLYAKGRNEGIFGRLRGVVTGPDNNLYILTSNRDGRGDRRKGDDKILRLTSRRRGG